jgi:hypothetical protein
MKIVTPVKSAATLFKALRLGSIVRTVSSRYLFIVVLGFIVLVLAFSMAYVSLDYDNCVYYFLAKRIAEGSVPYIDFTLFKTPLYPYLLAFIFLVTGVGFPQILMTNVSIGVLTLVGIYLLGKELHTTATGVLSALVYAAVYFSIYLHTIGKTEPLFNLLLVYAILFHVKPRPREPLRSTASPLLLALAFYTLPRATIPALGGIALTLLTTATLRRALRYLGLFTLFATALSAPFLLLAPTEFLYNVFLFNTLRGFQNTPGVAASIQWLLERGSLTLFTFGTLGLLLTTLHAWNRLPKPLHPLTPRLHKSYATLLASLFLLFWVFLALPQFAYPYMIYPVWPLLATGAALLITPLIPIHVTEIVEESKSLLRQRSLRRMAPVLLTLLFLTTVVVDSGAMVLASVSDYTWSRDRENGLDEVASFIQGNLEGDDLVLSFDPGLSIRFVDRLVLPPDPDGGSLDLINYFPYKAFSLMMENNTSLNPVSLLAMRKELEEVQIRIQAKEFSALLSRAAILVFNGEAFLETYFPDYEITLKKVIAERCRLLQTFGTMSVYRVEP